MTIQVHSREEEAIRRSERAQLAALFEANIDTLTDYAKDSKSVVGLICLLLRMNTIELDVTSPGLDINSEVNKADG